MSGEGDSIRELRREDTAVTQIEYRCLKCRGFFMSDPKRLPACPYCGAMQPRWTLFTADIAKGLAAVVGLVLVIALFGGGIYLNWPREKAPRPDPVVSPASRRLAEEWQEFYGVSYAIIKKGAPDATHAEIDRRARECADEAVKAGGRR